MCRKIRCDEESEKFWELNKAQDFLALGSDSLTTCRDFVGAKCRRSLRNFFFANNTTTALQEIF